MDNMKNKSTTLTMEALNLYQKINDEAWNTNCKHERFFRLLKVSNKAEQRLKRRNRLSVRETMQKKSDSILDAEFLC
jgi:hypothetical protein